MVSTSDIHIHTRADPLNRQMIDRKRRQIVGLQAMVSEGLAPPPVLKFHNHRGDDFLVAHFPGSNIDEHYPAILTFQQAEISVPDNVTIFTFATRHIISEALLIHQLDRANIAYFNPTEAMTDWEDMWKISSLVELLPTIKTEYTLVVDGFDVLLCGKLDPIVDRFKAYDKKVLFNAAVIQYPDIVIERIECRDWFGRFRYLNAGAGFGATVDMFAFYRRALEVMQTGANDMNEQITVRRVLAEDTRNAGLDYRCSIFQTFLHVDVAQEGDVVTIY